MKILASLFLAGAFALGGCATTGGLPVTGASVPANDVVAAVSGFDVAENVGAQYLRLPLCPAAALCRTASVSSQVAKAVRSGRIVRGQVEAALAAANGGPVPVATYANLQAAFSALQAIYAQYGLN